MDTQPPGDGPQPVHGDGESPVDAFKSAARHFGEAKEYAATFIAAKADAAKLSFRRAIFMTGFLAIAGLTAAAITITAAVLLTAGIASAIGQLFDPPKPWVGQIIVGLVVLIGTNLGIYLIIRNAIRASRNRTVQKYEARHNQQRSRFGHDVTTASIKPGSIKTGATDVAAS